MARVAERRRVREPAAAARGDQLGLVLAAIAGLGLNVAMFFAFDLTTVAIALLAFYTYPALVAVVAVALGHERLDGTRIVALGLALAGMVLVVGGGLTGGDARRRSTRSASSSGSSPPAGRPCSSTVSRGRYTSVPSEQAMGWVLAFTAVACAILAAATGGTLDVVFQEPRALAIAAFAGIVAAGIPSVLFLIGIRAIGGTRAGILMLFEPLVGVTLAALLLDEALTPVQVLGGVAILGAALLLQRGAPAGERIEPAAVPSVEHG